MQSILIINYGMGNLQSVKNAIESLGGACTVSSRPSDIANSDAYILPGVGAFYQAMENINALGIREALEKEVLGRRKPFLGICLGMQMLATDSVEKGYHKGLGWLDGHVVPIERTDDLRLPHVGWNVVRSLSDSLLLANISDHSTFYFDHSYHFACEKPLVIADCEYGVDLVAAVQKDNIMATQFHPEKSQSNGLRVLRNFMDLVYSGKFH